MTARLLRWLLLLQASSAAAIAWWAHAQLGASALGALALGIGSVLLVRLAITANNFFLSWRLGSATPPGFEIGPLARLRLFFEEFIATLVHSSWIMPLARASMRIYPGHGVPVLLLHGYGCNSGYWQHLIRLLDERRISHAGLDLEPMLADIDDYVPLVERALGGLLAASGSDRAIIVAHSMGGLVARAYMRRHGTAGLARVVTLGTPHHGTGLARFGAGRNAEQMRHQPGQAQPESDWLRELAREETPAARALITSLYTHHDNIVAPQTSSLLEGARHVEFCGVGHVALGRNRQVLARVLSEIDDARAQPPL